MRSTLFLLCGMATIMLAGLKIAHLIDWSWWLVFSPLIFYFALNIFLLFIFTIFFFIRDHKANKEAREYEEWKKKNNRL